VGGDQSFDLLDGNQNVIGSNITNGSAASPLAHPGRL